MNRALRRHPVLVQPKGQKKPPRLPSRTAAHPRPRGVLRFVPPLFLEVVTELRKVTWPSRQETYHLTLVVIVVAIVVGAILGGIDYGFAWLIDKLIIR